MSTSSITKDYVLKDPTAIDRLVAAINESKTMVVPYQSDSLDYGRQKLKNFIFQDDEKKS